MENIFVAIITGGLALVGVIITNVAGNRRAEEKLRIAQAITDAKIEELTREVRKHNNFAEKIPVIQEQIKVVNHRLADLEDIISIHALRVEGDETQNAYRGLENNFTHENKMEKLAQGRGRPRRENNRADRCRDDRHLCGARRGGLDRGSQRVGALRRALAPHKRCRPAGVARHGRRRFPGLKDNPKRGDIN